MKSLHDDDGDHRDVRGGLGLRCGMPLVSQCSAGCVAPKRLGLDGQLGPSRDMGLLFRP